MILRTLFASTAVFVAGAIPTAFAQGFYADGGYASVSLDYDFEDEDFAESFDFDFGAIGGHVGYDFSPYFGVEGELLIGVKDESLSVTIEGETEDADIDANVDVSLESVYGVFGRAIWPVSEQFTVFGRAGYVSGKIELSTDVEDYETLSDSDEAFAYGVGATFVLSGNVYARGDYTRYDFDGSAADMFMIGAGVRF